MNPRCRLPSALPIHAHSVPASSPRDVAATHSSCHPNPSLRFFYTVYTVNCARCFVAVAKQIHRHHTHTHVLAWRQRRLLFKRRVPVNTSHHIYYTQTSDANSSAPADSVNGHGGQVAGRTKLSVCVCVCLNWRVCEQNMAAND